MDSNSHSSQTNLEKRHQAQAPAGSPRQNESPPLLRPEDRVPAPILSVKLSFDGPKPIKLPTSL